MHLNTDLGTFIIPEQHHEKTFFFKYENKTVDHICDIILGRGSALILLLHRYVNHTYI